MFFIHFNLKKKVLSAKFFLPLLFLLFIANPLKAQPTFSKKKVDSLLILAKIYPEEDKVILYQQLTEQYKGRNTDSVFYFANLALESAQNDKSDISFYEAYKTLGDAFANNFDYTNAIDNHFKAKEYILKTTDKNRQISIFLSIGNVFRNLRRYSEAIEIFKLAIEIAKDIEDFQNEGLLLYRISLSFYDINDYNKALEYSLKSANTLIVNNIETNLANTYNFIGYIHMSLINSDLAHDYFQKSYSLYSKENNIRGMSSSLNNLGIIFNEKKDNTKALEYYTKSLEYSKQLKDDEGLSTALNNIGMIYVELGQIDKGIDSYFQSLDYSIKLFDKSS